MRLASCVYDLSQLLRELIGEVRFNDFTRLDPLTIRVDGDHGWNFKLRRSPAGKSVTISLPIWSEHHADQCSYYTWRMLRPSTSVPWYTADIISRINYNRAEWMRHIDSSKQSIPSPVKQETTQCRICGDTTVMVGSALCDLCGPMASAFVLLAARRPEAAKRWLEYQLGRM